MTMPMDLGTQLHKLVATILKMAAHSPLGATALIQLLLFICALEADSGDGMTENLGKGVYHSVKKGKAPNILHVLSLPNNICLLSP